MIKTYSDEEFGATMNQIVGILEKAKVDSRVPENDFRFILEKMTGFGVYSKDQLASVLGYGYHIRKKIVYLGPGRTPKAKLFTEAKAPGKVLDYFKWTCVVSVPELYRGKLCAGELETIADTLRLSSQFLGWARSFIYVTSVNGVWPGILVPMIFSKRRGKDFTTAMEYAGLMNPELVPKLDMVYLEAVWNKLKGVPFNA